MSKQDDTWYVVADGGKARILERTEKGMRTVRSFDASGRGDAVEKADSAVSQSKAPKSDPKDQAETQFAKAVTEFLNESVRTGKVDSLVIAAPAPVLHEIREQLSKAAAAKVGKTMSKDYTNTPDIELAALFD